MTDGCPSGVKLCATSGARNPDPRGESSPRKITGRDHIYPNPFQSRPRRIRIEGRCDGSGLLGDDHCSGWNTALHLRYDVRCSAYGHNVEQFQRGYLWDADRSQHLQFYNHRRGLFGVHGESGILRYHRHAFSRRWLVHVPGMRARGIKRPSANSPRTTAKDRAKHRRFPRFFMADDKDRKGKTMTDISREATQLATDLDKAPTGEAIIQRLLTGQILLQRE